MKKPVVLVLLFVLLVGVIGVAAGEGQTKSNVCHINDDGEYVLISIADPAVDSHIAHGDVFAGTNGLDENCEPESQYPGGCTLGRVCKVITRE